MKLKFEGRAIIETKSGGVRFAGYCLDQSGRSRDVLCRVTREALEALSNFSNLPDDALLDAYFAFSERINSLASAQFAAGIEKPAVTLEDIPREWLSEGRAA